MSIKKKLWMLISSSSNKDIHLILPTISWMAQKKNIAFECYLEAERDGKLFAASGSTVIGGFHHQQFNYLNMVYDVEYIFFGENEVFSSTIDTFGYKVILNTDDIALLYEKMLEIADIKRPDKVLFSSSLNKISTKAITGTRVEVDELMTGPYIYPEIFFSESLAYPVRMAAQVMNTFGTDAKYSRIFVSKEDMDLYGNKLQDTKEIDFLQEDDTYSTLTLRIAERWKKIAEGVAFGDPSAIISMIPSLCSEKRFRFMANLKESRCLRLKQHGIRKTLRK